MIKFFIIVLVLISKFSFSNDFKLVCNEISKSVNKDFSKSFVKIINFVDRTVLNYSEITSTKWFYLTIEK